MAVRVAILNPPKARSHDLTEILVLGAIGMYCGRYMGVRHLMAPYTTFAVAPPKISEFCRYTVQKNFPTALEPAKKLFCFLKCWNPPGFVTIVVANNGISSSLNDEDDLVKPQRMEAIDSKLKLISLGNYEEWPVGARKSEIRQIINRPFDS
ncbi:hypothetical protein FB451DRAFT_1182935 [Mycena latifolia]|nr:hypothetical protein FB451DRAFT_1182935 [Mycena latifolia]